MAKKGKGEKKSHRIPKYCYIPDKVNITHDSGKAKENKNIYIHTFLYACGVNHLLDLPTIPKHFFFFLIFLVY